MEAVLRVATIAKGYSNVNLCSIALRNHHTLDKALIESSTQTCCGHLQLFTQLPRVLDEQFVGLDLKSLRQSENIHHRKISLTLLDLSYIGSMQPSNISQPLLRNSHFLAITLDVSTHKFRCFHRNQEVKLLLLSCQTISHQTIRNISPPFPYEVRGNDAVRMIETPSDKIL